jgi:hypothetical protein
MGELCLRRRCAIWKARVSANVCVWNFALLKLRLGKTTVVSDGASLVVGVVVMRQDGSGTQYFRVEWTLYFVQ